MPETIALSEAALALLRRRVDRETVELTPENLDAHRELVAAGILVPMSGFVGGRESSFRFTEEGWRGGTSSLAPRFSPPAMTRSSRRGEWTGDVPWQPRAGATA